ncbi:MAG: hypothetical protein DRO04_02170 [Candidatus Iainarchaeum archaeon]|uniref:Uncharacterized protein n=1 Tax=Candidatus Iainarchaeum sp. TaxID=3101447 RepID=A0A497JGN9_9ARCH|nr:MAG: hypothetical protein DRO04_02170 [Candidatus Diapherotrites archaeon]
MKSKGFYLLLDTFLMFLIVVFLLSYVMTHSPKPTMQYFYETITLQKISDAIKVRQLDMLNSNSFMLHKPLCESLSSVMPNSKITIIWNDEASMKICNQANNLTGKKIVLESYIMHGLKIKKFRVIVEK